MPKPPLNHVGSIKLNLFLVYHVLLTPTSLFQVLSKQSVLVLSFEYLMDNSNVFDIKGQNLPFLHAWCEQVL
jgi:hypothetical protein